jgi:hypothetical protein
MGDTTQDLMKCLNISTVWEPTDEWGYVDFDEKHVRVRCVTCPMQLARLKQGMGELPCKEAGLAIMESFSKAINPKLKARCIICPPDKHPEDLWCEWEWELSK